MVEFGLTPKKVDELFRESVENGEDETQIGSFYRNLKKYVADKIKNENDCLKEKILQTKNQS
jgi:hypothetical protein